MSVSFPTQFATFFSALQTQIASVRAANGLPALNGPDGAATGTIAIGQEYQPYQLAAPSVVVVPTGEEPLPAKRAGTTPYGVDGTPASISRKMLWASYLNFDAYLWGDPDPNFANTSNVLYDFDSTLELRREFLEALYYGGGSPPGVRWSGGRWDQPTNERRSGRMYILSFSILSRIDDEPYIYLPFATQTASGVTIDATIQVISPDGSSSINVGPVIAPP